jgi:DNA primase large subunit
LQFGYDDLAKYTFLPQAGDFIRAQGISIQDLTSPDYQKVVERAEQRVLQSIMSTKVPQEINDREVEIMSFPVSLMLVKSTNLEHVMSRYALAEAIRIEQFLKKEKNRKIIEELFKTSLGIELEHNTQNPSLPEFKIPLQEYLKRATQFHKTEWKLVNKIVGNGQVYLDRDDLIRLIREEIRVMIMERLNSIKVSKLPENLQGIVKKIIDIAPPPPQSPYTIVHIAPENYPPCVRTALNMLDKGENIPHYGRFLMATYLLSVGKSVEEIVAMFPKAPDFKQNVTRYQVEHLAGLKGGRTRYRVPSCKTLQTHQFCFKDPVKCYEISSPLQYPSRKGPELVRASEDKGSQSRKRNRTNLKSDLSESATTKGRNRREWTNTQRR